MPKRKVSPWRAASHSTDTDGHDDGLHNTGATSPWSLTESLSHLQRNRMRCAWKWLIGVAPTVDGGSLAGWCDNIGY